MTMFARVLPLTFSLSILPIAAMAEPDYNVTERPDGSAMHWTLDRPAAESAGIIVLAQGSGCLSVAHNDNLAMVRASFPDFAALMIEKPGVEPGANPADDHMDCSAEFRSNSTVSQRVADYRQIIDELRNETWWNGQIVLFGGSEGGLVAAVLAAEVEADAAILFSTAGGLPFGQIVRQSIPEEGWPTVDAEFEKARQNPESTELWAGSSYRFWADIIDRRVADDMLRAETAFLLIQGGNDPSSPIETARATNDLFAAAGRCNLTYWEFPGYDHAMGDANGNAHMADVLAQSKAWLDAQLSSNGSDIPCMRRQ